MTGDPKTDSPFLASTTEPIVKRTKLLVFVPDSTGRIEPLLPLIDVLKRQEALQDAQVQHMTYKMPWWGNQELSSIAHNISATIEAYYVANQSSISEIVLCGYSLGVLLARRAYLDAKGYGHPEGQEQRWGKLVSRIVLMGAICRGFKLDRLPIHQRIALRTVWLLGLGQSLRSAFWGQPFVSNVRVDWIALRQRDEPRKPLVVNVLGAKDKLALRKDAIDLEQDPGAAHVDIPEANHDTVIIPSAYNQALLVEAFVGEPPRAPPPLPNGYRIADKIYMLVHGMRSSRQFVLELAEALQDQEPSSLVLTPGFGYIPIVSFLSRAYRQKTAAEFVDQYTQWLAVNPHAQFYFAGHSNGTCILGEVLDNVLRIRFARLYLGGSALPTNFNWTSVFQERKQVTEFMRSDRGSEDWAVGIFARALEKLSKWIPSFRGVGSGGYEGFSYGNLKFINEPYFEGGHGVMFERENITSIIDFLTDVGRRQLPQKELPAPAWFRFLHKHASLIVPAFVILYVTATALLILSYLLPIPYLAESFLLPVLGVLMMGLAGFLLYRF